MKTKITHFFKTESKYLLAAFFIPVLIMVGVYLSLGIYPGSARSVLASDAFSQFSNFHASFNNVLHGKQSLFYSWDAALGLNYYSLVAYYLGGVFTPLVFLFDNRLIPDALYFLTLIKIGAAAIAFWVYAKNTFRLPKWSHVALAVAYSLMSFATAHSELIMWLDAFVYLPLIILGINRVMDLRKPTCLFIAYFILFVSNFYMAFMIGVFSVLYFAARLLTNWSRYKKTIVPYFITSLLAGCASMIMILPTVIDLRTNGETLSSVTKLKTEATGFWDIVMKNMIGVFDTTKYGSIPFIYVGLLPLVFCLFYFVTKKVPLRNKLAFGSIFIILIASFYFVPLNLFWHGMHAPNMFLFRYSFLFSFLVIMLAGYGWEQFTDDDGGYFIGTIITLMGLFVLAKFITPKTSYTFVSDEAFYATLLFLILYLLAVVFYQLNHFPAKRLAIVLLILMSFEAALNTTGMLNGILEDWNYASRSLYSGPYPDYKGIIDDTQKKDNDSFYRMESLDAISSNDSLNYGYAGVSLFSSIRNRHSSSLLNDLGFRSRGTNLNLRYANNTLLMDSLLGIKYNFAKNDPQKFGFEQVAKNSTYQMYRNQNALPLGILTDNSIYKVNLPKNDNLQSQTNLFNQLAGSESQYFSFTQPTLISSKNTDVTHNGNHVTYQEQKGNIAKDLTWEVDVPAGKQAYLSLFPTDFGQLNSSTVTMTVNGISNKSQIGITGQYYNLGYYPVDTKISFTASFYGSKSISLIDPPVVLMDVETFQKEVETIQSRGVDFDVKGRKASATVEAKEDQVIFTTIPYDKGWTARVDGKKVPIKDFKDAFLTIPVTAGKHHIQLSFLPSGFLVGVLCFFIGMTGFGVYVYWLKRTTPKQHTTRRLRHN